MSKMVGWVQTIWEKTVTIPNNGRMFRTGNDAKGKILKKNLIIIKPHQWDEGTGGQHWRSDKFVVKLINQ